MPFARSADHKVIALLFLVGMLALQTALAVASDPQADQRRARLDAYIAPYVERHDFSGVILIARGDDVLVRKAYGMADVGSSIANTSQTRFCLASITKTFTAAGIIILSERKLLGLDDPLSKFLPDYPNGGKIRIRHLLAHAAGVPDPETDALGGKALTPDELIGTLRGKPLEFEPGTRSRYSNGGYVLLARVIEKASGRSFAEFLKEAIFQPLGMKDTGVIDPGAPPAVQAHGYAPGPGPTGVMPAQPPNPSALFGSGCLCSTVDDLRRWAAAIRAERLFKRTKLPYLYGWGERKQYGHRYVEQSGRIPGFMTHLILFLDQPVDVVCLGNTESGLFGRLEKDLTALAFGGEPDKPPPAPERAAVDAKSLRGCVGRYQGPGFTIRLTEAAGELYSSFNDSPARAWLTPVAGGEFFMRAEYAPVRITRDPRGRAIELSILWGGAETPMAFRRIDGNK